MLNALLSIFAPTAPVTRGVCVLPAPPAPRPKAMPAPKVSGVFVENAETRTFGFRHERETDRAGAVPGLTGYDREILSNRGLWGGRAVIEQNRAAKVAWHNGETVAQCAAVLRKSDSWVEKRFAAFGSALLAEAGERG